MYVCPTVCVSVCLTVSMHVCMYVHLQSYPFVCLLVCLSACLSVCLSVHLFVCLPVCLSICLSVYVSVCLSISVYVSVCLSVCLSVYVSVCPSDTFLHTLSKQCSRIEEDPFRTAEQFKTFWRKRFSLILQRCNAKVILKKLSRVSETKNDMDKLFDFNVQTLMYRCFKVFRCEGLVHYRS